MQYRHILHATDFSRASAAAFGHAVTLARDHHARLTLVHVVPDLLPLMATPEIGAVATAEAYRTAQTAARREAQASMDALVAAARAEGVHARARIAEGVAHVRIAQVARRDRADLLVMGTHGRSGLAGWFLGSVAARVIAAAPCPVLTMRETGRVARRRAA